MFQPKSFLCLDLGAGSVKAAEFETTPNGALNLKHYDLKPLGPDGAQESKHDKAILAALKELHLSARQANLCAPGFQVFSKFVKLPPVDSHKVRQIIQYEAQQNIPYPLAEAVWDFQITGSHADGALEVLLVAIKAEAVESLFRNSEAAGLKLDLVDAAPAALANAFKYNYGDQEGCSLLLDIGAKTTNVLLFEKGRIFARSINIGANAITQEFAAESKVPFAKAEALKTSIGSVSLGGAYEDPDDPQAAAIAKIARQVFTRLHIQINQTIQFYRGQQGGSAPTRLYLAGGASIMPYTTHFFAEKLNVPVEYFNPFRNISIDPSIDLEDLSKVAHTFGEVVGLALRNLAQCPIELNLVPKSIRAKQSFRQKQPYFIASIASVVCVIFAIGLFYGNAAAVKRQALANINKDLQPLEARVQELAKYEKEIQQAMAEANALTATVKDRFFWPEALVQMRSILIAIEEDLAKGSKDVGVWIENFGTVENPEEEETPMGPKDPPFGSLDWMKKYPEQAQRYFKPMYEAAVKAGLIPKDPVQNFVLKSSAASTNLLTINVKFRAVSLNSPEDPAANGRLVFAVADAFKNSGLFDPEGTRLSGPMEEPEPLTAKAATFRFGMVLKLKNEMQM